MTGTLPIPAARQVYLNFYMQRNLNDEPCSVSLRSGPFLHCSSSLTVSLKPAEKTAALQLFSQQKEEFLSSFRGLDLGCRGISGVNAEKNSSQTLREQ